MRDIVDRIRSLSSSRTGRLMITYLAIIMTLTIVFSSVIFVLASSQLDRPPHSHVDFGRGLDPMIAREQFEELLKERSAQAKNDLIIALGLLNLAVLVFGTWLSHFLARKTLEPIEEAMDAQSQFVSDASHELRTPLTALQTTNEVALRKKNLNLDEAKELIGQNVLETVKLRELTNALLGLVREEHAYVEKVRVDIRSAVNEALQTIIPLAQSKTISVEDEIPEIYVEANISSLSQVVRILLENAIKYSPEHSTIRVSVRNDGDKVELSVVDTGVGIAASEVDKIFRRFYRVDSSRGKHDVQGYGLGLAIAKAICDRQSMKLGVKSKPDQGATFTIIMKTIK